MQETVDLSDSENLLESASVRVVKICIPVVVVLVLDVICVRVKEDRSGVTRPGPSLTAYLTYGNEDTAFRHALLVAVLLLASVLLQTIVVMVLYHYRRYSLITLWMIFTITFIFTYCFYLNFSALPRFFNFPLDFISSIVVVLNLVVVSNLSILWRGPKVVTQVSLLLTAVLFSVVFVHVSDVAVWILLVMFTIYDLIVVLVPIGPLRILGEEAFRRGETIPALIYTSLVFERSTDDIAFPFRGMGDDWDDADDDDTKMELGLGDFWFYGILMTRAARLGWDISILCLFAVVLGLALTLFLLDSVERPMPALPISLTLGIAMFAAAVTWVRPFLESIRAAGLAF
jgi:hypothetical protein